MELVYSVQKYEWGKKGSKSTVAQLAKSNASEEISENSSYAELWMGVHPSGPSRIKTTNQLLSDYIKSNPKSLGDVVINSFGPTLPYLFKVLSIEKALSIQAHPSKKDAEVFFFQYPDIYKDPNHKPELAIALTDFEALCGFRPAEEILEFAKNISELEDLIGHGGVSCLEKGEIRPSFRALMTATSQQVKQAISQYLSRNEDSVERRLVEKLQKQFPNDVGVLCVFWLNFVSLSPGEALFLGPNEPHAYIYGDCVECMANSDNVVRAGLTPKFRDVQTLCDMLTYKSFTPAEIKFPSEEEDAYTSVYKPPVTDFAVERVKIPSGESYSLRQLTSASIVLTVSGSAAIASKFGGVVAKPGTALFIPANEEVTVSSREEVVLFRAYCNL